MCKKIVIRSATLILISFALLVGCTPRPTSENVGDKEKKDELVLAVGGEPETGFDPTTGWGRYGSPLFQSTLLKRDENMKISHDLATDYDVRSDGKVWTVSLRNDVQFSDGHPLQAEDVIFTFETAAQNGSVVDFTNIQSLEAPDPYTVVFTLKEAQSTFIHALVETGIVPKHAYSKDYANHPIGSGPFEFIQWDKGQQLIIQSNSNYYEEVPFFKKVTLLFLSEDAALAAAKSGEVDVVAIPASFSKQKIKGMKLEALPSVDNRGIIFPYVPEGETTKEGYPIGNNVTADRAIRHALNVAIDREALIQGILEGHGSKAFTPVDKLPWWNPDTVFEDGNVKEAKQILEKAGWKDTNGDKILEKGELKAQFTLFYPANDLIRQSLSIAVADMMKEIGIVIDVEGASWDQLHQVMYANPIMMGWGSHNPQEMYNIYSSTKAGVDYYNIGYYKNAKVDEYLDSALRATTEKESIAYWKKAQWDGSTGLSTKGDAPWAWLVNIDHLYFIKEGLDIGHQSIHPHGHGFPITSNLEDWKWK